MAILSLVIVLSVGTTGYWLIGERQYSLFGLPLHDRHHDLHHRFHRSH